MSLNAVIRRLNIPSTACQWLQYVLSLLNYGLIPLTHMSRQKNSEEGYGVLLQQVSTFQAKITDIIAARGSDLFEDSIS